MLSYKPKNFSYRQVVSVMVLMIATILAGSLLSVASAASLQGTILENDSKTHKVMIVFTSGVSKVLSVPTGASITIDSRPVQLFEIKPGMDVEADYSGTVIKSMQAFSTMRSGYSTPGNSSMNIVGELLSVDRDSLQIRLDSGKESTIAYSAATVFTKLGAKVDQSRLAVGDRLKVVLSSAGSTFAESVSIESVTNTVSAVYKGKIEFFDQSNSGVAVSSLQKLVDGAWVAQAGALQKFYFNNGQIAGFLGAASVEQWKLPYYKGSDVYIIASDFYGKPTVSRMIFKNNSESVFSDKISEIDWYANIMELKNGRNVRFGDGTVFIKGGRIVDRTALNTDSDALVLTGGSGKDQTADIISIYDAGINDTSASQFAFYAGNMQYVLPDRITYNSFYYLEDNEWRSFSSDEKDVYFDNDTKIYDEDAGKFITSKEFYYGNYAYNSSNGESNYFSYICADNDRAVAILLRKKTDSVLQQRVTQGIVSSLDTSNASVGAIAVVDSVTEWNTSSDKWVARDSSLRVGIATAAIVKNGQAATVDAIKPGDYLFMVRDDFYVRILVVR